MEKKRPAYFSFGAIVVALIGAIKSEVISSALEKISSVIGLGQRGSKMTLPILVCLGVLAGFELKTFLDKRKKPLLLLESDLKKRIRFGRSLLKIWEKSPKDENQLVLDKFGFNKKAISWSNNLVHIIDLAVRLDRREFLWGGDVTTSISLYVKSSGKAMIESEIKGAYSDDCGQSFRRIVATHSDSSWPLFSGCGTRNLLLTF